MTTDDALYSADDTSTQTAKSKVTKAASSGKEETTLERLRATISKKVERPAVFLEVPERPGVTVKVSPNITQNQMRNWRKQAGEESRNGLDATKFACMVIGHTTQGILMDGIEVFDEDGNELTFASSSVLQMTDTTRPIPDCVRAFFGIDPHVESAALAILDRAGYSDTVDVDDPTKGSSAS